MLNDTIQVLTEQMIKNNFVNKDSKEEKYIITKQELYNFSIKLINKIKEVYND